MPVGTRSFLIAKCIFPAERSLSNELKQASKFVFPCFWDHLSDGYEDAVSCLMFQMCIFPSLKEDRLLQRWLCSVLQLQCAVQKQKRVFGVGLHSIWAEQGLVWFIPLPCNHFIFHVNITCVRKVHRPISLEDE